MDGHAHLSRRERQIMDIIYERGEASVKEIRDRLPEPPSHTAVRTLLRILEGKGHVKRQKRGREFYYSYRRARHRAGQSAMKRVLRTFFDGSLERALAAHLTDRGSAPTSEELRRISALIKKARQHGD